MEKSNLHRFHKFSLDCYNISICEKGKFKDETSKKIRETKRGQIKEENVPLTKDSYSIGMYDTV